MTVLGAVDRRGGAGDRPAGPTLGDGDRCADGRPDRARMCLDRVVLRLRQLVAGRQPGCLLSWRHSPPPPAVARVAPGRWRPLLGGFAIAMTVLCGWSLLVKVFPSTLASTNAIGRLQAPFGYWNAIGLCGAIGLPACLWAGARRDRGRLIAGLAAPALCLLLSVDVLSYSRSADAAGVVAIALWLIFAPLRLRSIAMLAIGAARRDGDQCLDAHPRCAQGWFGLAGGPGPRRPHVRDRHRCRAGARHRRRILGRTGDGPDQRPRRCQTADRLGAGRAARRRRAVRGRRGRGVFTRTDRRGLARLERADHDQRARLRQRRRPRVPARLEPADLLASGDRRRRTCAVQGRRVARLRRRSVALHDQPRRGLRSARLSVRDVRRPGAARRRAHVRAPGVLAGGRGAAARAPDSDLVA